MWGFKKPSGPDAAQRVKELMLETINLRAELSGLRDKNADLHAQATELRKSRLISDSELAEIARIRAEHTVLNATQNEIAVWLREHKGAEISLGRHNGRTLPNIVIEYMGASCKIQ